MRKWLANGLLIGICLHSLCCVLAQEVYEGRLGYIRGETEIAIVDYLDPGVPAAVEVPETIEGLPVTAIQGFGSSDSIVSIHLPETVRVIGEDAFIGCRNLQSINFPSGLVEIGEYAFWGCERLSSPIDLPEGLVNLGQSAFASCVAITSVRLPNTLRNLEFSTFERCLRLISVQLPAQLESLKGSAFYHCPRLAAITFPPTLRIVGYDAFFGCVNLTEAEIPASVEQIGENAFSYCGLRSIAVAPENTQYKSLDGVLFDRNGAALIQYPQGSPRLNYTIPQGVSTVLPMAFANSIHLKTVSLPPSLRSIEDFAFDGCVEIDRVNFSPGLLRIEDHAFRECRNLRRIYLPEGLERLDWWAFKDCVNLRSAVIPASVRQFWPYTFYGCASLTALAFEGTPPDLGPLPYPLPDRTVVYYSTSGGEWPLSYVERTTRLWDPEILTTSETFGIHNGHFVFSVTGTSGLSVDIEFSDDLSAGDWGRAGSVTLQDNPAQFVDPGFPFAGNRTYRLVWP